jgi:hypothetical protein
MPTSVLNKLFYSEGIHHLKMGFQSTGSEFAKSSWMIFNIRLSLIIWLIFNIRSDIIANVRSRLLIPFRQSPSGHRTHHVVALLRLYLLINPSAREFCRLYHLNLYIYTNEMIGTMKTMAIAASMPPMARQNCVARTAQRWSIISQT